MLGGKREGKTSDSLRKAPLEKKLLFEDMPRVTREKVKVP